VGRIVRACVCACVRACVRECVRACVYQDTTVQYCDDFDGWLGRMLVRDSVSTELTLNEKPGDCGTPPFTGVPSCDNDGMRPHLTVR
jgi:hypothetical protein